MTSTIPIRTSSTAEGIRAAAIMFARRVAFNAHDWSQLRPYAVVLEAYLRPALDDREDFDRRVQVLELDLAEETKPIPRDLFDHRMASVIEAYKFVRGDQARPTTLPKVTARST